MYSGFTACFTVADSDYSPINDHVPYQNPFDQSCFADLYTTPPDQSLATFLDHSYFDWHQSSVNCSSGWDCGSVFYPAQPFDEVGSGCASIFETVPAFDIGIPITPSTSVSSTSPFCGDAIPVPASSPPSSSEHEKLREAPALGEEPAPKQPGRKRGRLRLDRKLSGAVPGPPSNAPSWKHRQHTSRQPHVQVERKYREGLNSGLERLRRAVPTLLQRGDGAVMGQPKLSKAMVLSCAVAYIAKIEHERDGLREGNEQLGGSMWGETIVRGAHVRETATLVR
ncbi:uncharacterized protein M421DRAFT_426204 [Didymella exigua CBS 183.55]|uniref:BHLH domain-containing protein n=1 Tax=Didymella exigua CBS 183.55 TaxID=1150837 RepID=A0A6A5RBC6_9PLEO|nr:uncharacterized protein M421DRAFT_426204 [Didymella exigua CBS 183.55]KAF1923097.1 hypothetical protein M421DRAFT_426204 [Didymella exigua CBS 183.55]